MVEDKKDISGKQLRRQIGGTRETSWRMLKLIRQALDNEDKKEQFEAVEYFHQTINHSLGQYGYHRGKHTNGIESVWALIKRGLYGMYHHVSVKYLQNHTDEFCFRLDNRENENVFDALLKQCVFKGKWQ